MRGWPVELLDEFRLAIRQLMVSPVGDYRTKAKRHREAMALQGKVQRKYGVEMVQQINGEVAKELNGAKS